MALVIPNEIDHAIKDKERIKRYIRFMDDGIIQNKSKETLNRLLDRIHALCDKLGLKLNVKKTHITKASKGFTFLKIHYIVTDTGRIIKKIAKNGVTRMRRKLKKFRHLIDAGKMQIDDAFSAFRSWMGNAEKIAQTYRQRKAMLKLYNRLFKRYRTGGLIA